jgi:hypothetical protein
MSRLVGTGHSYYCLSVTMYKFSQADYADLYNTRKAINFTQSGASLAKCPFLLKLDAKVGIIPTPSLSYSFSLYLVRVKYKCICFSVP